MSEESCSPKLELKWLSGCSEFSRVEEALPCRSISVISTSGGGVSGVPTLCQENM